MSVITLDIHVEDLDSVLALFDRIQVWRSINGEHGDYSEITAATEAPASLTGTVAGPWAVSGKTLSIVLNSADPIPVVFTGADPLNISAVIHAINTAIPNLASDSSGKLKLTSPILGTGSSLQVSGDAAPILGLSTNKVDGLAARIYLVDPTCEYIFRDYGGLDTYWYKTRYFSTATGSVSSFSDARQGNPQSVLPVELMSRAYVRLTDVAGRPIVNRRIIFVPQTPQVVTADTEVFGILPGFDRVIITTDYNGFAEVSLLRGMPMKAFFEGSSYHRDFVVPNQTEFDLMTVLSTEPDPFTVTTTPPMIVRVS